MTRKIIISINPWHSMYLSVTNEKRLFLSSSGCSWKVQWILEIYFQPYIGGKWLISNTGISTPKNLTLKTVSSNSNLISNWIWGWGWLLMMLGEAMTPFYPVLVFFFRSYIISNFEITSFEVPVFEITLLYLISLMNCCSNFVSVINRGIIDFFQI